MQIPWLGGREGLRVQVIEFRSHAAKGGWGRNWAGLAHATLELQVARKSLGGSVTAVHGGGGAEQLATFPTSFFIEFACGSRQKRSQMNIITSQSWQLKSWGGHSDSVHVTTWGQNFTDQVYSLFFSNLNNYRANGHKPKTPFTSVYLDHGFHLSLREVFYMSNWENLCSCSANQVDEINNYVLYCPI